MTGAMPAAKPGESASDQWHQQDEVVPKTTSTSNATPRAASTKNAEPVRDDVVIALNALIPKTSSEPKLLQQTTSEGRARGIQRVTVLNRQTEERKPPRPQTPEPQSRLQPINLQRSPEARRQRSKSCGCEPPSPSHQNLSLNPLKP